MTDFQGISRPKTGSKQASVANEAKPAVVPTGAGETASTQDVTAASPAPKRRPVLLSAARRAAVVAMSCAVLVGAAAAGQAGNISAVPVSAVQTLFPDSATTEARTDAPAVPQSKPSVETAKPSPEAAAAAAAVPVEQPVPAPVQPEPTPGQAAPEPAPAEAAPVPAPVPVEAEAPAAPEPVVIDDPAGAQAYAQSQLASYGWGAGQMPCLVTLWTKESDWLTGATNPTSGAYGIVQSLPAEKMASAGADYRTNYRTQINWGLNYIQERYQSPCNALNFHLGNNWY